jgi:hypothetical protein
MDAGTEFHTEHGAQVARASLLRTTGWVLLLASLIALAVGITLVLLH